MKGTYQSDLQSWVKAERRVAMRIDSASRRLQRCDEFEPEQWAEIYTILQALRHGAGLGEAILASEPERADV